MGEDGEIGFEFKSGEVAETELFMLELLEEMDMLGEIIGGGIEKEEEFAGLAISWDDGVVALDGS